jgi:capsular polysaccharide transport system permease protein
MSLAENVDLRRSAPQRPGVPFPFAPQLPKGRPVAGPVRAAPRHRVLMFSFFLFVLGPVFAASGYLYKNAADQYASTLGFTVRSEDVSSPVDLLGGYGGSIGGSGSRDSDILYEFIGSQELVARLDARLDLKALYGRHAQTDPVLAFGPEGTIEDLVDYWQRMVRISYDSTAGLMELRVLAFDPAEATAIAEAIYEESSLMINELSAIARNDATRYAKQDLDAAILRLKAAREAMTSFRVQNQIVDPKADIQGQMGLLNTLQAQLAEALINQDLLDGASSRRDDPRLAQAQRRIDVIEARIADERRKFGVGSADPAETNYATKMAEFERLSVDTQFAERAYTIALANFDAAMAEANRKSRYLAAYIKPTKAEKSAYPQRGLFVGLIGLFAFLIWSILALSFYAIRDRR